MNNEEKINVLVEKSHRILVHTNTVFPFDFFPDSIILDENKITIVKRLFFWSQSVFTFSVKDILSVNVSSNPLFSSLSIEVTGMETNPDPVQYLWAKDATKIKALLTGLITCTKAGIETATIADEDLVSKIEEIGRSHTAQNTLA